MNRRRTAAKLRWLRAALFLCAAAGLYCLLLCNPDPLFAHSIREGTIVLHTREPISARAREITRDADARIARSPLYEPSARHHVYICDSAWSFALFSLHRFRAGGVAYGGLTPNVFLRPSAIERDRLVRWNGTDVEGERTLTYFIAHEVTHALLTEHLGPLGYLRLPTWINEGYADYVAKAGAFDYQRELQRYREGASELDPAKSHLYDRYHLAVSHWLEKQGSSVGELLLLPNDRKSALPFD